MIDSQECTCSYHKAGSLDFLYGKVEPTSLDEDVSEVGRLTGGELCGKNAFLYLYWIAVQ